MYLKVMGSKEVKVMKVSLSSDIFIVWTDKVNNGKKPLNLDCM